MRRGVLSTLSSIFDPLDFITPFTLLAKKLLCRNEHLDWADDITENYNSKWQRWCAELPMLEEFHIDRCYKPPDQVVSRQPDLFCDATMMRYGCIHGMSRITCAEVSTVPRLELTNAI